ncbi:MAG: FtsQ-type POTRA domain-containing protein [Clostridia bacterium]|nr:FtsQ-type POTRA domain-containing protein [Clostridia bacterium]
MDNNNGSNNGSSGTKSWQEASSWFEERKERIAKGEIPDVSAEEQKRTAAGEKNISEDRIPIEPKRNPPKKKGSVKQIPKKESNAAEQRKAIHRVEKKPVETKKSAKKKGTNKKAVRVVRSKDDERVKAAIKKKKKKVKSRARNTAVAVFLVAVTGLVLCLFFAFKTADISVEGKTKYSADEIISASGIELGDYVWKINKKEVNRAVCKIHPYIGSVKVSVKLPSTVRLIVTAAKEKYAIPYGKNDVIINEQGKVLNRTEKKIPKGAVELLGVSFANDNVGDIIEYDEKSEGKTALADTLISKAAQAGIESITAVNVENTTAIYAVYDARVKLYFGNQSDLDSKMRSCKGLLDTLTAENKSFTGVANLSNNGKVYFLPGSMDAEVTSAKKYEMQLAQKEKADKKSK